MLARKVDDQWVPFTGSDNFEHMETSAQLTRMDGTTETITVDPYPVEVTLAANSALESWSDDELAVYGLAHVVPFVPPEGKQITGDMRLVESNGVVSEDYDVEDIPAPPPPPTALDKLQGLGLTLGDLKELIAEAQASD